VIWVRSLSWAALAVTTLAAAAAPELVTLPEPAGAIVLDHAIYLPGGGDNGGEVSLPHALYPWISRTPNVVRYQIDFDLPTASDENLFVFIPSINRRVSLVFNGETLFGFESSALWTGPFTSTSVMVRLPRLARLADHNRLTVIVDTGPFAYPTYLSRIYLGSETALALPFQLRTFLAGQLKTMAFAAHVLLGFGVIFAYFFRPKDPLFAWLATFNVVSFIQVFGLFIGWQPAVRGILPFIVILIPATGIMLLGVALALLDKPPVRALRLAAIALPCIWLPCALIGTEFTRLISAAGAYAVFTAGLIGATGLMAWGAFWQRNTDARLMLAPFFLVTWFALHDGYITATLPRHGFDLLLGYARPVFLAFVTAVLMRRMGVSLNQLDRANENLNIKLAEREAELAVLHRQEQIEAGNFIREHERRRLTRDLHDGISGHLASIIALSERTGEQSIEQAAREALNDLRLVIYSLDLGDRELPLAFANFRERLVPQLQRLGVELDWSIAELPEVSGVTPGNALALLRILQEAITNAVKHGPARKINIRGIASADGMVAIVLENDGRPFVESNRGHGLANMRRRAQRLHGKFHIEALARGSRITLLLPPCLPDYEDEAIM
jgi:signal transduction histidine kinase